MKFPFTLAEHKQFDVVGFGTNAVDFLIQVPEYPAFNSKIELSNYTQLAGGEVAAMVLLEAVVRLIPGVLGAAESHADESFENGLLEYPQYTRPQVFEGREIPAVLTSGDHGKVAAWRRAEAEKLTRARRPDLLDGPKPGDTDRT